MNRLNRHTKKNSHPLPFMIGKAGLILALLAGWLFFAQQARAQGCTSFTADLSSSPTATWTNPAFFSPSGQCCGTLPGTQCFSYQVTLHPSANAVVINLSRQGGTWGFINYYVDCLNYGQVYENQPLVICLDGPGPHTITFCRSGSTNPSFSATIAAQTYTPNVTLDPFEDACTGGPMIYLTGGSPFGGSYFINGTEAFFLDPATAAPGTYTITYVYSGPGATCAASASQTITINQTPTVSLSDLSFCDGSGLAPMTGGTPPGGEYLGTYITSGMFDTNLSGPGTFPVKYRYTSPEGCTAEDSAMVVVAPLPPIGAGPSQTIDIGTSATLSAQSPNTFLYNYHWTPEAQVVNPNQPSTPTVPLMQSQLFTLTVTNPASGCQSRDQTIVYVRGGPLDIIDIQVGSNQICQQDSVSLIVIPTGGSGNYLYEWFDYNTPPGVFLSDEPGFWHSPNTTTTYRVIVTDALNPLQTATAQVTIQVIPLPDITIEPFDPVCGNETYYPLTGAWPPGGYYSLPTQGLINVTSVNPRELGEGFHIVSYTIVDGQCRKTESRYLEVYPRAEAKFYAQQDFCSMHEVTFLNLSENTDRFDWQIGTEASFPNQPKDPFDYTFAVSDVTRLVPVTLTATNTSNGCVDVRTRFVEVIPQTRARFSLVDQDTIGCAPYQVRFTNQTTGPVAFYLWDFGDGSFSTTRDPVHTFNNHTDQNITYDVVLMAMSGNFMCVSRDTIQITVRPFLKAGFGLAPITSCSPYQAEIFNDALGLNITQRWDFGDGTSYYADDPVLFHTFNNHTPDPQTFTITQVVTNPQGCADSLKVEVTVYPFVQSGFVTDVSEGCAPLTVAFTDHSAGAAYEFFWDFDDGGTSSKQNPTHTFYNNTDLTQVYRVMQVAGNHNFCSDTTWIDIVVHPEVQADFALAPTVFCAPNAVSIPNISTGNVNSHNWYLVESGISTPLGSEDVLNYIFQNAGPDPVHYLLGLEVNNQQGCISRKELPVTVFPEVTALFTPSQDSGCQPLEINFVNHSQNGHVYYWDFGDGGSSSEQNPTHIFQNFDYTNIQTFNVSLYVESVYLCSDTFELEIELLPALEALFTIDTANGCSPFEVSIDHFSKGASVYAWDFGDGSPVSDFSGDKLSHTYINNTNHPVQYTLQLVVESALGCLDTLERIITVYPEVTAAFTSDAAGCHPFNVTFNSSPTQNAHYFYWEFGEEGYSSIANPQYTFINTSHIQNKEYTVTLEALSVYGCRDTYQETITVYPVPDPSFVIDNPEGCTPFTINIANLSQGGTSHYWTLGDGATSAESGPVLSHTYYLAPGNDMQTRNIRLVVRNDYGCTDSLTQQVTIYPQILADFAVSSISGCHPLTVEFTNLSQGASAYANYFWTYGDGFASMISDILHSHTFLNHSYTDPASYTVQLIAMNANACSDIHEVEITVQPSPLTNFSISEPVGCSPHTINLENLSQGGSSFVWSFGDGNPDLSTTEPFISHSYVNPAGNAPAQFTISLQGTNDLGCSRSLEQTIIVYPEVEAAFSSQDEGCHPLFVDFQNLSVGATHSVWNFGEGNFSLQQNPSHLFMNHSYTDSETYVVSLYAQNDWGCHDSISHTVTVRPVPLSNFDLLTRSGCSPFTTEIFNLSQGALNYSWEMGNDSFDGDLTVFSYTWTNTSGAPVNHILWLSVSNEFGCSDHSLQSITVYPEVEAAFTTSDGILAGCSPFDVQFLNFSQLTQSYTWDFGDGTTTVGANPWHRFTNEGPDNAVFTVQLAGTSLFGCKDTTWLDITVYPTPVAKFDATPKLQTYPSRTITLNNLSKAGHWNYDWTFGDGNGTSTTSPDPFSYTYGEWDISNMNTRTFAITLNVENQGCEDSYTQQVTITSPVPQAVFSPSAQGCAPFEVQFFNISHHAHSYLWQFGDGSFSIDQNPRHLFVEPGLYEVQLIAYGDGGSDTTFRQITVHPNPVADFALVKPIIEIPYEPLQLINRSLGADFFHWDFGDGNTSTEYQPTHWYQQPGVYTITLAVGTDTQPSCRDTLHLRNALLVQDACSVKFPNAFTPQVSGPHGGSCNPFDLQNTTYEVFYPKMEGIDKYELEIFNRWGELIFRSTDPYKGWDGYYRGRLSPMDVYVWKFSGICTNGQPVNLAGDVTLIR